MNKKHIKTIVTGAALISGGALIGMLIKKVKERETKEFRTFACEYIIQDTNQIHAEHMTLSVLNAFFNETGKIDNFRCKKAVKADANNVFSDDYYFTFRFDLITKLDEQGVENLFDMIADTCYIRYKRR